jgi:histidinol dehydrogenase
MIKITKFSDVSPQFYEPRKFDSSLHDIVQKILDNVKAGGDKALKLYSSQFDKINVNDFLISKTVLKQAADKMKAEKPELFDSLSYSFNLALQFAKKQRADFSSFETELVPGLITGQKTIPVERAGLYVPAGRFPLLSTVIMCASPAKAAACHEIILCTPPREHPVDKSLPYADEGIMAAAYICGIDKVFACGGSQAVAAMAYGTESIPKCDVIVGPGNKFVAEAKRSVYGTVGIDMVAGPTEVLIIADDSANPAWVAADMLAQAEHDIDAQPVLVTNSSALAKKVSEEIEKQLAELKTAQTAGASVEKNGIIIVCNTLEQMCEVANKKAPEHLELAMDESMARSYLEENCLNYGSMFIGHESAEVLGDYAAGLNHTLPTSGTARFTGGLSVRMFLKTVTTLRTKATASGLQEGVQKSLIAAQTLGHAEGLEGHANAATIRIQK